MAHDSPVTDELLRQLMAVGQVDVLVGVPTLNNATTVATVINAVHQAFARYFPRYRTVLVNTDGGSDDDTRAVVRNCSVDESGTLTVSHSLRTIHRISTPYHGVPGKGNALRQILLAAELSQARAIAVLDAEVTSITPEWIAALIRPVVDQAFDYVAPIYPRHPLDGPLVSQMIRPLLRAGYGWQVQEPLASEFGCSLPFATHCLEQPIWDDTLARYGIDLWITGEALAGGYRCAQTPLGHRVTQPTHAKIGFQEIFRQVVGSAFGCLERHAGYCLGRSGSEPLPTLGAPLEHAGEMPTTDGARLTQSFCEDLQNIQVVLEPILSPDTLATLNRLAQTDCDRLEYPDDLWATTVYEFLVAHKRGVMRKEHITQALIPLYLGRTGSFLIRWAGADPAEVNAALDSLCLQFERSKPHLVERWNQTSSR